MWEYICLYISIRLCMLFNLYTYVYVCVYTYAHFLHVYV